MFKINDVVYTRDYWSGLIAKWIITDITHDEQTGIDYARLKGDIHSSSPWSVSTHQKLDELYASEADAIAAYTAKDEAAVQEYKSKLNNIEDFLRFACNYCIASAEEYTDYEARRAFQERAKEVFGIDL